MSRFYICSQYDILFHFSCHSFYKVVIGLVYLFCVSHSLFELPVLVPHTVWIPFQFSIQPFLASFMFLLLSVVSGISLRNCPYILLFFHSSFFSLMRFCLNSFLFTGSLYYIVSAAFTPLISGSTQFLTYYRELFSFILMYLSQLSNPLPPIILFRYTQSTSLLGCSIP